jgi:hypothetical protein
MKNNKSSTSRIFLLIGTLVMIMQIIFDTLNVSNLSPNIHAYIGAGSMLLVLISSGLKQYFDPKINSGTIIIQACLFVAFVTGGVLDQFDLLPFGEEVKGILRIVLTVIANSMPIIIKTITQEE